MSTELKLVHLSKSEVKVMTTLMVLIKQGIDNPTFEDIAFLSDVNSHTVRLCIKKLTAKKLITTDSEHKKGYEGRRNRYTINNKSMMKAFLD